MSQTKKIVKQATILGLAGILVRIIGLLYRSPLTKLITAEGMGYYNYAYNLYAIILLISSYSVPTAISKLISEKIAVKQYSNAKKIFKCSFIYICAVGGGAAIITFFLAPYIVADKASADALKVLCPTIFLSGILGVFRGYFQAHQTTVYTSISQIIEQVFNAIVSIGAAYLFIQPYVSTGGTEMASAGATGSAVGTGAGVLIALIFMMIMYMKRKDNLIVHEEENDYEDSTKDIFQMILSIVTPIIIATCVYNLTTVIDMYLFSWAMKSQSMSQAEISTLYGVYSGQYIVLQNVPVALASAMATASIPAISSAFATNDISTAKKHIQSGMKTTMLILIPSAIGMFALAYPIFGLLFPQKKTIDIATRLLMCGSPTVVFFGLSTFTNGVLQAIGYVKVPLKNAIKALIYHVLIMLPLLFFTPLGIYSLLIGNLIYGFQMCYLNQKSIRAILDFKINVKKTVLLPLFAAITMGILAWGTYQLLFALTKRVFFPLMIAIAIGVVVYFGIIIYIYSDSPEELESIPYGDKLVRFIKH